MLNFKLPFNRFNSAKAPFWLSFVFIVLAFILGLALGGNVSFQKCQSVIKGLGPNATTSLGLVKNQAGEIPEYLTKDVDFNLFWDVWNIVKEELDGKFEGIGAEIGIRNNILAVIAPLDNSPAIKAGLQPKDLILEINGNETEGMSLSKAVSLIRGKSGTEVVLTVYRDGLAKPQEISIIREAIKVKSLELEFKDNNLAYIKIRQFNSETVPLFNDAVIEIIKKPEVAGIILDLRYNPGGYLQAAIDIAGEWVDGEVVVKEKLRGGEELLHRAGYPSATLNKFKTVVLVNDGSASGSEIVAGALQDLDRATIVGEKTYGKGSVQKLIDLKDGSSIKLTVAKWFPPQGNSMEGDGITPDVEVEMTEDDYNNYRDPQLAKALEILLTK